MTSEELLKAFCVGLTGGIATGKSTVARLLAAKGFVVIDADQSARQVTAKGSPGLAEVVAAFGPEMLTQGGELDRKKLGAHVFQDEGRRKRLEGITHPRIRQALEDALLARGLVAQPRLFFYEAALLVETRSYARFRALWVTACPEAVQLERLTARDGHTPEAARKILAAQMPLAEKLAAASQVIDTGGTLADTEASLGRALAAELAGTS
jgi:dephospho-CoA kinase